MMKSRVTIVGNAAAGKTRLSHRLSKKYGLPITHVDSIQFIEGMKIRPLDETRKILEEVVSREKWLIDGYGPLDLIEKRFAAADEIIFIDLPLWRHYLWAAKRQIKNIWSRREELPPSCNELTLAHTVKLFRTIWKIHTKMRPQILKIFARDDLRDKVVHVRSMKELRALTV